MSMVTAKAASPILQADAFLDANWEGRRLERLGAIVLTAPGGVGALEMVPAGPVDLVLCDLQNAAHDGFEFLRELDGMQGRTHR